jgi:hypothetical protein
MLEAIATVEKWADLSSARLLKKKFDEMREEQDYG